MPAARHITGVALYQMPSAGPARMLEIVNKDQTLQANFNLGVDPTTLLPWVPDTWMSLPVVLGWIVLTCP